jgi:hypothetical protein
MNTLYELFKHHLLEQTTMDYSSVGVLRTNSVIEQIREASEQGRIISIEGIENFYQTELVIKLANKIRYVTERNNVKTKKVTPVSKSKKVTNRFYVAHSKINSDLHSLSPGWAKPTLEDAIEHARKLMEENHNTEECLIVEVIRVVRRKKTPISVEKV